MKRKSKANGVTAVKPKQSGALRDSADRVHLAVHHDRGTGETFLALTNPVFKHAWQDDIAIATANTARGLLRDVPTLERVVALARNAMAAASHISDGLLARAPAGAVACKRGCDHCCFQSVGVTPPEALAIFTYLTETVSAAELVSVAARVAARHDETRDLSIAERFSPAHPCPFLGGGQCTIYDVRPLACRGMNSLDADECATRLRDPAAREEFLAGGRGGHTYMEPIRAFHAISAGLQLGLEELYLLDMRPLELTTVMHLLLSGTDGLPGVWMGGDKPFASAVRKDAAASAGLRELSGAIDPD
jgi:hypothetical protein